MNDILASGKRVINTETKALEILENTLDDTFSQVVEKILTIKGRVIVSGIGKPGHIGQKIAASLASTGTPSFFLHPSEASHGDLGMVTRDDLLLVLSNSGESKELADVVSYSRRFNIPLVAITSRPDSSVGKNADYVLRIPCAPDAPEACPLGLAPTTSMILTLAMGDALAIALLEARKFSAEDYSNFHPGGKLGKILLKVRDLMAKGDALPLIPADTMMSDTLVIMTQKSFGCVGVTDENGTLIGMITDGDLRRHMSADLIVRTARDVMNPSPKTLQPDITAAEALRHMDKITNMFVVDENNKPVGLLHIHHLLQAGII